MRTPVWLAVGLALVGCGDKKNARIDAAITGDANTMDAPPDAPPPPPCENPVSGSTISFRQIGQVSGSAVLATSPPGDTDRLFVLEQNGRIRLFKDETLVATPFLDVSGRIIAGGENGLLGLAFHPQYASNGTFFIFYTADANPGAQLNNVDRCQVSAANPDLADGSSCVTILSIPDFAGNHNGGMLEFGADNFLYIATGDGGGAGDPQRTAQNLDSLLGKILRIDVDNKLSGKEYGIPVDNPFAGGGGAPEIFIYGLRNPWRFSFDRGTGDLWIGDVGQNRYEELTVLRAGSQGGANLGWSVYEGNDCCMTQDIRCAQTGTQYPCDPANKVFPQVVHALAADWVSIITGQTYRGTCYPDLVGWHFYTDYGGGTVLKARLMTDNMLEVIDTTIAAPGNPASLHADARGELYLTNTQGRVYHLEAGPP